jgi:hypothetical protein
MILDISAYCLNVLQPQVILRSRAMVSRDDRVQRSSMNSLWYPTVFGAIILSEDCIRHSGINSRSVKMIVNIEFVQI